ncbi:hypothetical protein NR798_38150 [Archangium gephyra]|uniref:hypothetical protein n=1 Tax=Archangium gephyra TaxID=48 RepID=UPI0035D51B9E
MRHPLAMQPLHIERIPVSRPHDYKGLYDALGELVATWVRVSLADGVRRVTFPRDTVLVFESGAASVTCGNLSARVGVGQRLQFKGGLEWEWRVLEPLTLFYRPLAPNVDPPLTARDAYRRMVSQPPAGLRGAFVSCPLEIPPDEALPRDGAFYLSAERGPLYDALFTLPQGTLSVHEVDLRMTAQYVAHRASELATGFEDGVRVRPASPDVQASLKKTKWYGDVSLSNALAPLEPRREELLLVSSGQVLRWQPEQEGAPFLEALRPHLRQPETVPSRNPPPDIERLLETILSSFWTEYPKPPAVPYPVGLLCLEPPVALSAAFRERWSIRATCPARESSVQADRYSIVHEGRDAASQVDRWTVNWRYGSSQEAEHAFVTSAVDGTLLQNRCVNYRD